MSNADWQTSAPPSGTEIELATADGRTLTGAISYVASYTDAGGVQRRQYQLRKGPRGVFEVVRWRRVESASP